MIIFALSLNDIKHMAKSSDKMLVDPEIGEIVFRKRLRSRSISIRVHPVKGVSVSVPYIVPYAAARLFFEARRDWILETMARQREKYKDVKAASPSEIEALRRQAKAQLPGRLAQLAARYGFTYNRVSIKHNASNWGSCSTKGNINLNLNIARLPKVLQDYVLLHELCHLRHPDHGQGFHLLLEHLLTDNIMKLLSDETLSPSDISLTRELARKAAVSKARYPLDYTITRAIKQYRVV
jgi:predicted metal-dependent hydrolase